MNYLNTNNLLRWLVGLFFLGGINIKTCKAAALSAGTILNAAICTIRSKHETWFIFSIFLMFGYIDLKVNDLEVFSNR